MLTERKAVLRKQARAVRDDLDPAVRARKSKAIARTVIELLEQVKVIATSAEQPLVLAYLPFRSEVDTMPVVRWCWTNGIAVAAPRVDARTKCMQFYVIRSDEDVVPGAWGIPEPVAAARPVTDYKAVIAMLMPGLAFDEAMGRLGYGGGYYDRFFSMLQQDDVPLPNRTALAYDEQLLAEVPTEAHDVPMSCIITDRRVLTPKMS